VCEALGMTLPGAAPVAANSPKMFDYARRSGQCIVQMIWDDIRPRAILTPGAFANAAATVLAVSGSINTIKHLQAIAVEAGMDANVYAMFERAGAKVPVLAAVRPNGKYSIEEFEAAGGARAILKQLEPMLDTGVLTVTGKTLKENLSDVTVADDDVIRPLARPFSKKPAIVILHGSLAPDGAIVKMGLSEGRVAKFAGKARVFDTPESSVQAVQKGEIKPGEAVVLRNVGVRGGPGMGGASRTVFALDGMGLGPEVAVVTDGQLSGLVNVGLVVGEVTPESAVGGPLALVENGDRIAIDVEKRTIDLDVPAAELAARRARLKPRPPTTDSGWLSIYERTVSPLSQGASLLGKR
jgi:dihydroxy-acid dehydratase